MCCHWLLDYVLLVTGECIVEGKVFAVQWERAGGQTGPARLEKRRRRAAWGREKKKSRGGMNTTYNHRDSKGMVMPYGEISFSTAVRVLFPNTKMIIFLYILDNCHHS